MRVSTMKRFITILIALFVALNMLAAYNQQGIAYFYDYKTKKKTPLAGVSIAANGAQPAVSAANGTFTLKFSTLGLGQKISFSKRPVVVAQPTLKVFNKQVVDNWYIVQGRLVLIMCKYEEFELAKNNYYAQGKASVEKKYKEELAALERKLKKESREYADAVQNLLDEREMLLAQLDNAADAMARIDQSELDDEMQEILDLYERGDVDEAMQKLEALNLKEKFEKTLSVKQNAEHIATGAAQDSIQQVAQIRSAIDLYKNNGDYAKAGEHLKLLADRLNTWEDMFNYASFCQNQNLYSVAEEYYLRGLDKLQHNSVLSQTDKSYKESFCYHNLAELYSSTQRITESESMYKLAIDIRRKFEKAFPGTSEISLATSLTNLAGLYERTQRYTEGEDLFLEAIEILKATSPVDSLEYKAQLSSCYGNLGVMYIHTRRFKDAEEMIMHALEMDRQLAIEDANKYKRGLAIRLYELGEYYLQTNKSTEAKQVLEESELLFSDLAKTNPERYNVYVVSVLNGLGVIYKALQNYSQSEIKHKEALSICDTLIQDLPNAFEESLAYTLKHLGCLYNQTRRYKEGEAMFNRAIDILSGMAERLPSAYKSLYAEVLENFGGLYKNENKFDSCAILYNKALEIYTELENENKGIYKPQLAMVYNNLGQLYFKTKDYTKNEESLLKALELYNELVKEYPNVYNSYMGITLNNLGNLYFATMHIDKAEPTYKDAVAYFLKASETNPLYETQMISPLKNLGLLLLQIEEFDECEEVFMKIVEICKRYVDKNPPIYEPYIAESYYRLGLVYEKKNQYSKSGEALHIALELYQQLKKASPQKYSRNVEIIEELLNAK